MHIHALRLAPAQVLNELFALLGSNTHFLKEVINV